MKKTGFYLIPEMVKSLLGRVAFLLFMLILFIIDIFFCIIYLIFRFFNIIFETLSTGTAKVGMVLDDLENRLMEKV